MNEQFVPFELERLMGIWEKQVEYNLSESGVHPLTIEELVESPAQIEELLAIELTYPHTNGTAELRERISALYPGATPDNVLVTTGAAQANFSAIQTMLAPGDEIVVMLPNYMQIWGAAHNFGFTVKSFPLDPAQGWAVDVARLEEAVTEQTKLIAVCNPNNPTGHIMPPTEMDAVVAAAGRVGAWILADEVYAGAERVTDNETPSFWGHYERVLATNSMSKAYGLPGLRVGWVVTQPEVAAAIWARQDYTTISATMLGNALAAYALSPDVRPRVLARTRDYIRKGYANLEHWLAQHGDLFTVVPPEAAAIALVGYDADVDSVELVERLAREKSAYVAPGDHFGIARHVRVSYGLPADYLNEGLARLQQIVAEAQ